MGVSLVERRCFQEALQVFQDSLRALIARPPPTLLLSCSPRLRQKCLQESIRADDSLSLAEIEHKIYRATLYLKDSSECEFPPALESMARNRYTPVVVDDDDSPRTKPGDPEEIRIWNQYGQNMNLNPLLTACSCRRDNIFIHFQPEQDTEATAAADDNNDVDDQRRQRNEMQKKEDYSTGHRLLSCILHNTGQTLRLLSRLSRPSRQRRLLQDSDRLLEKSQEYLSLSQEALTLSARRCCSTPLLLPTVPEPSKMVKENSDSLLWMMTTTTTTAAAATTTPIQNPKRKLCLMRSPAA